MENTFKQSILQKDYSVKAPYIDKSVKNSWVPFDTDNLFPQRCIAMVNASTLQKSIIANKIKYAMGTNLKINGTSRPNLFETWNDILIKIMTDYVYLNAFAIQIIMNNDEKTFSFYHIPCEQVRLGNYNENNQIEYVYLCNNWRYADNSHIVKLKLWGSETPQVGEKYIAYFKKYYIGEQYYAIPDYYSCANWIKADIALSTYYLNFIKNNFSANLVIKYPLEPDEDKKDYLYNSLKRCFGGDSNAGSLLLLFGENGVLPEISSIESRDADLYNQVCEIVTQYIISGNQLTSPTLAGITTASGFSSQSEELIAAYVQYKMTVIDEIRAFVLKGMKYLMSLNGEQDIDISIEDYDIRAEFEGNTVENDNKENNQINSDTNGQTI